MLDNNLPGMLDFHNLYAKEALHFLSDYIKIYKNSFILITGRDGNSKKIRPFVINFLKKNKFEYKEEGPSIHVFSQSSIYEYKDKNRFK